MMTYALSTTFGYVDIAILVILALFLILGLIRGLAKSLNGFFLTIATVLISLLLMGVTFAPIRYTSGFIALEGTILGASSGWGDSFNDEVYKNDKGEFIAIHNGQEVSLSSLDGVKGKIAEFLAKQFYTGEKQSVAGMATANITSLIVSVILFIAYCIGFGIIFAILRRLTRGMHRADSVGVKVVDRIGGGLVASALGFLFILVILAIFAALQNKIPSVIEYIQNSAIGKFFYDLNPIGKAFAQIFSI